MEIVARQGNVEETRQLLEKAVKVFPQSELMWSSYVEYVAVISDVAQAVSVFHRAKRTLKQVRVQL